MTECFAIIPAGGMGLRMGHEIPKQFLTISGVPILIYTIRAFLKAPSIKHIVLAVPKEHFDETGKMLARHGIDSGFSIVRGGRLRQDSVRAGLESLPAEGIAVVHDAVRPLITPELIEKCVAGAKESGAAILAIPVKDTLKRVEEDFLVRKTVDRSGLWQAQTPQAVSLDILRMAYDAAERDGFEGTDEASLLEHAGVRVVVVQGAESNIKITRPGDLEVAEGLLMKKMKHQELEQGIRTGQGFDAHRLVEGRKLVLGGVTIKHPKGLLGHSDADVLVHALCDAVLGALGEGDLGRHFPDNDQQYKDVDSLVLLGHVMTLASERGMGVVNADITVIAQQPKLAPHIPQMCMNVAQVCGVSADRVNIKATTTEGMGFTGREEGVAAQAAVLLARL